MGGVLEGIRVLDVGRYIAGPWCAALLGDLGAEVIRVEKVSGSEDRYLMPVAEGGEGALLLQVGRNKRGMALDPTSDGGRAIMMRLIAASDVVVANLPPSGLSALGLDYESVRAIRPDVILTTVTTFGTGGPLSERVGFDGVAQALSGAMHLTGPADRPMKAVVAYVDFGTAMLAALGTLAAILHRERTGEGQHVEASLLATALSVSNAIVIEEAINRKGRVGTENRGQHAGPSDAFRTRDGWILVQCVGDPLFRRWCRLVGEEGWISDPRFVDDQSRGDHGEILSARMAKWCEERSTAEALSELDRARVPAGEVLAPAQVLEDGHIRAMKFLVDTGFPGLPRPAPVVDTPVRFSTLRRGIRKRAPLLGEDTEVILLDLGFAPSEIAELRSAGAIR
jgi:crotonobetainyl-CoA:carnitine CoA-transferase CaiB-like acyl-CoA transferase